VMVSSLGGIEVLVFTGGIGENSPDIRRNICARLEWMGVQLDDGANGQNREVISTPDSPVNILMLPTDEEIMIARHTREVTLSAPR
jgi:acetate kinase